MTPFEKYYNADYEAERNKLIPIAEKFANKQFGSLSPRTSIAENQVYAEKWSKCFISKVDRLYAEGRT